MIHRFESFSYNYAKGIIKKEGSVFELTKIQKKLLNFFIDNPCKIFSKQELMENVWERIVTENSVDQVISILRNQIEETPSKPTLIVTRYGQGMSFEGIEIKTLKEKIQNNKVTSKQNNLMNKVLFALVLLIASLIGVKYFLKQAPLEAIDDKPQQLLVMPITFSDQSIASNKQLGMKTLLKTSFTNLDNEGQIIFDETSETNKQAIEKHFRLEKSLLVIHSQVEKVGNIYHSNVEVNNGQKIIKSKKLSANNLNELINSQINLIAGYQNKIINETFTPIVNQTPDQNYLEALGYLSNGNLSKAKELLENVLKQQPNNYQARLSLAKILLEQKHYDKSFSQLETIKVTQAYESIGAEIELTIASINLVKSNYKGIIEDLKTFQLTRPNISEVKKARIKIVLAYAYHAIGDTDAAMTFYRNAVVNMESQFNPFIFAQSLYGQAMLKAAQSNDDEVYQLFEKSYKAAIDANDVRQQVMSLNEMAKILHYRLEWDKAIAIQNQALELLELEKDQHATVVLLATLIPILQQQGYSKDAHAKIEKFGKITEDLNSDLLRLHHLHYQIEVAIEKFEFAQARNIVNQHLALATETKNYAMVLDNAFLEFELRLERNNLVDFKQEWDKRTKLIKEIGFERFQIYMDLYLGRFYKQANLDEKAITQLNRVSEQTKASSDFNFFVEAQNYLAEIYLKTDAEKALKVLNNLEQYNPQPSPYLVLKAKCLNKLGNKIEALNLLNQAKLAYHDHWNAENQNFLDSLKVSLK